MFVGSEVIGGNETFRIKPTIYGQLIYNKEAKNVQWERDTLFNK